MPEYELDTSNFVFPCTCDDYVNHSLPPSTAKYSTTYYQQLMNNMIKLKCQRWQDNIFCTWNLYMSAYKITGTYGLSSQLNRTVGMDIYSQSFVTVSREKNKTKQNIIPINGAFFLICKDSTFLFDSCFNHI